MPYDGSTFKEKLRPDLTPVSRNTIYLQNLGQKSQYEGGGPLSSSRYSIEKQDREVADVLYERGYNVIGTTVTKYSLVPGLAYDSIKYQSSAMIPSVVHRHYLRYMDEVGAWFRFDAPRNLGLRAFTVHALPERLPVGADIGRARAAVVRSRQLFNEVEKEMRGWAEDGFRISLIREEHAVSCPDGELEDFVHFHGIFTAKRKSPKWKAFLSDLRIFWAAKLRQLRVEFDDLFLDVDPITDAYLWQERVRELEATTSYMAKPSMLPAGTDPDSIEWMHQLTMRRPMFKAYADLAAWRSELKASGDRIECIDGYYRRVTKRRDGDDDDYPVIDDEDDGSEEPVEAPQETAQAEEVVAPDRVAKKSSGTPANVLCGPTMPRSGPGGRKESFFVVSNVQDGFFDDTSSMERDYELMEWRDHAHRIWEEATGQEFSIREYLRPRAERIWEWVHHEDAHFRAQIRVSDVVLSICRGILVEAGKLKPEEPETADHDDWHDPQENVQQLTKGDPPPF